MKRPTYGFDKFFCKLSVQTSFACILLCKRVVIKPLRDVFNYNLACFK